MRRGGSDADREHQRERAGVRTGEERGDTEIRLIKKNERMCRSGAELHGEHVKKTTCLS